MTSDKLKQAHRLDALIKEKERTIATIEEVNKSQEGISGGMMEVIVNATPNPHTYTALLDKDDILFFLAELLMKSRTQLGELKLQFEAL